MYKATKEFEWEMAHVLSKYEGPCGNLHGHSYKCLVTFEDEHDELYGGMIADFKDMKKICNHAIFDDLDHCVRAVAICLMRSYRKAQVRTYSHID